MMLLVRTIAAMGLIVLVGCSGIKTLSQPYQPREPNNACPSRYGRAIDVGANPDDDSVLGRTQVRAAARFGAVTRDQENQPDHRRHQRSAETTLGFRYGGTHVSVLAELGAIATTDEPAKDDSEPRVTDERLSNFRVGIGYRTMTRQLGGVYRRALGIRAVTGIALYGAPETRTIAQRTSELRPFDRTRFMPGQHYEIRGEARYELMGCHAPFVHVNAGAGASQDATDPAFLADVVVGAHPNRYTPSQATLYAGYGVVVDDRDRAGWGTTHRVRLGVQFGFDTTSENLRVDLSTTRGLFDGSLISFTWSTTLEVGHDADDDDD